MILFDAVQIEREIKWRGRESRARVNDRGSSGMRGRESQRESQSINAVKFFYGQRQFFEYLPLNLTSIFTSHFDLFLPFLILASSLLLTPFSCTTSVQSVGNIIMKFDKSFILNCFLANFTTVRNEIQWKGRKRMESFVHRRVSSVIPYFDQTFSISSSKLLSNLIN